MLWKMLFWSLSVIFPLPLVLAYDALAREPGQLKLIIVLGLTAYAWWLLAIGAAAIAAAWFSSPR